MRNAHVLLIGHGSIGKFHLEKLVKLVKIIDVVEPLDTNRSLKKPELPLVLVLVACM